MDIWYNPSWCGDYRIEADGESKSVLIVTDPTPAEIKELGGFVDKLRKKKWVGKEAGVNDAGESRLNIGAPIVEVGALLLAKGETFRPGLLTTVSSKEGKVTAVDGNGESLIEAVMASDAEAAVTTKRPTLCCPVPINGPEKRASEVLRRFSTRSQWEEWKEHGRMHCRGSLTGRLYRLAHRRSTLAERQGKVAFDVADRRVVHCHCSNLPPPEEVLTIKLTLEHREDWIRNPSGYFGPGRKFTNPFRGADFDEQSADGTPDAAVTNFVAGFMKVASVLGFPRGR